MSLLKIIMVRKMSNKRIIMMTLVIILIIIIVPTVYKINKDHNDKLLLVVENEFMYAAKKCYNDNVCLNNVVYLKELYDNDYLEEKLSDPITKKYYSEESYVDLDKEEISLVF